MTYHAFAQSAISRILKWSFASLDHISARTDMVSYCYAMSSKARDVEIQLKIINALRIWGLAYHKVYNIHKNLFITTLKSAKLFANN